MSFYRLLTSTRIQALIEFWCATGNREMCAWATDNIPEATEVRDFPEQTPIDLTDIINARLDRLNKARASNSIFFNEPDYLPSTFLERGLRCSAAVCLLKRGFWIEDLIDLIKDRSVKDLSEILRQLSATIKLFEAKWPDGDDDAWKDYDRVADALENDEIKKRLGTLREKLKELSGEEKQREGTVLIPFATGFLVGKNYLLTNYHVFNAEDKDNIKKFVAEFRYEQNALGQNARPVKYQLEPESFCVSDEQLDYTVVRVKAGEDYKDNGLAFPEAGENFGWLPMLANPTLIAPPITYEPTKDIKGKGTSSKRISYSSLPGEPVFIIQHPRGARKRVVLFNNQVQNIYQNFLQYQADADFGSSGSPILNSQWQLVGLHHAALVKWDEQKLEVQGNLGTRICEIVKHLETRRSEAGVAKFLDNKRYVVKQKEQPLKGRIYILVGHQRGDAPSPEHSQQEVTLAKKLLENIFSLSNSGFEVRDVLQECEGKYEAGIDYINQQDYQSGDVAIEIRINFYPDDSNEKTIVTLYHAEDKSNYKAYAEIVLQSILNNFPRKFSSVLQSDAAAAVDIKFCLGVKMPCLVMNLDFRGQDYDWVRNEFDFSPVQQRRNPAEGIWDGLKSWVKVLSPIGFWAAD
jgi:Trypsin-like peptidase domain